MNFLGILNSNAIATITNILLSSLLIFFTVRISKKSCKQEKEIHNRNVLIAREQRMFNIYHVFANCGRVLKTDEITELAKLNILIDTKEFPEIYPLTIQNILSNSQASQRINQLMTTPKIEEYDAGVEDYWKNVLSYENFDKYFDPFLVRDQICS